MFRILLYIFLIYLTYQFIFNFVFPVYKTTQQVKKGFRDMYNQANAQEKKQQASSQQNQTSPNTDKKPGGEYIDFEEIN